MRRTSIAVIALSCAQSVAAQEIAPCGGAHAAWLAEHADEMTATWTDTPIAGLIAGQPMPLGPPEPIRMTAIPNGFSALGEEPVRTYELLLTEDPFAIDPPGGDATLARIESEFSQDCAIGDLPRLTAAYTLEFDGQPVQGTIAAVVASSRSIHVWFMLDTEFGRVEQLSTLTR